MTEKKPIHWQHPQQMVERLQRQQRSERRHRLWQRVRQVVRGLAQRWLAMSPPAEQQLVQKLTVTPRRSRPSGDLAA